jgi:hypothetical protein
VALRDHDERWSSTRSRLNPVRFDGGYIPSSAVVHRADVRVTE